MPRPPSGPRRIDSSGVFYAVKTIKGKRHHISLKTKLKSEALRRWPEAQAALEELTRPPKYARGRLALIGTQGPSGELVEALEWTDNLTRDEYLYDEELISLITWTQAEEIAAKRFTRRRGKPPSKSWRYNLSNALRHLDCRYPLQTTPKDIRLMVDRMEQLDYAPTTIAIRTSALGGVIDSLIKGGYAGEDFSNPVDKVDTAAISTNHHYKAKPDDYKMELDSFYLQVIMYTGCRINEALKGDYSEQGWLKITKDIAKNKASIREIPLPEFLLVWLKQAQTMSDDCFRTHFNKHRPHDQLTPHSLRHSWKTAARLAGADEVMAERLMGHSVGKMGQVYGEWPREALLREAEKVWGVIREWQR